MKRWLLAALLLGQGPALAQEEATPGQGAAVEEVPAGEAVVEEAAEEEPAWEGQGSGQVDVYYLPTAATGLAGAHEYGDGFGGRGQYQFWKFLAVAGEYTARTLGDTDEELNDQRLGIGAVARNGAGDTAGLFLQFERLETELEDLDGVGVHGRISHAPYEWLRFYADMGYQRLEGEAGKFSGFEFNAGLVYTIGPVGLFADWRRGQLEGKDSGTRQSVEDVRLGARWSFGS